MSVTAEDTFDAPTLEQPKRSKGEEIRANIAANRAKRLDIADAMNREVGVIGHEVHKEDLEVRGTHWPLSLRPRLLYVQSITS